MAIRRSGLTLGQIAAGSGVDDGTLSRFVREERSLTLETADRLMRFLGVRVVVPDPPLPAGEPAQPPLPHTAPPPPAPISKRK